MANLSTTQSYYFSSNDLAADLFSNVAGFTFCALGGALYPGLYSMYLAMLDTVAGYNSTILAIFVVGVYVVLGSVSGLMSNQLVVALRDLVPGLKDAVGYQRVYKKNH
jgi:ABC-type antimicrobial peptide transport system permease subunit